MPLSEGNAAYDLLFYKKGNQGKSHADKADGANGAAGGTPTATHRSSKTLRLRRVNHTSSLPMSNKAFHSLNTSQIKLMVTAGCALAMLGTFFVVNINYEAKKNELSTLIAEREAQLQTLKNDYDGLMVEYDTQMSDAAIQEYAEKELGMQKRENFQLEWISVGEQNDFENEDSQNNGFIDWLASYFD